MVPAIRYLAVARIADKVPVADLCNVDSSSLPRSLFENKLGRVLSSGRVEEHGRLTITDKDVGSIHYDSDPACLYLVVTAPDYPQRNAFKLLATLRNEFEAEFATDFNSTRANGLTKKAKPLLKRVLGQYDNGAAQDKVSSVALQVEEVKGVMQDNINAVLKNQENLDTLLESSNVMRDDASTFKRSAVAAKKRFWWQNVRLMIAIVVLLIVLVLVVALPLVQKGQPVLGGGAAAKP